MGRETERHQNIEAERLRDREREGGRERERETARGPVRSGPPALSKSFLAQGESS